MLALLDETVDPFPIYNAASTSLQVSKNGQPSFDTIPDFFFRRKTEPGRSPMSNGLFIEAKIVDPRKTIGNYCSKGLMRYVDSLYAWDMPQAMMLGYLRNTKQSLPTTLAKYFAKNGKQKEYHLQSGPTRVSLSETKIHMHETVHERAKPHPVTAQPCGAIAVYHLWLNA